MTKSHPQFIEQLQERGLTSIIVAGGVDDPSAFTCSSWKSTYKSEDKNVGVVTKKRPLIQMHDFKPGTGTEVAAETAAARMAYVATSGGNLKLHINKEGIKYATLSYWDTAVLLLKVIDFLYFRESELRYMSYDRYK